MNKLKLLMLSWGLITLSTHVNAQCDPEVPLYVIDLSANPDTTWVLFEADALNREGQCCSASGSENCIQFLITVHPNSAGIFFDYDGAGAFGALNWQIDCGPLNDMRDTICITDSGPFLLTFCKPGTDNGNYSLTSVSRPTFPEDQFVPLNCTQPVSAEGVTASTINWESISPGAPGEYDSFLSCTDCLDPVYTPGPYGPAEVEYRVCGYPILDYCVGDFIYCDTVKFTSLDSILIDITPANPVFCTGGDVTLTANATGGDGNFTYYWYDDALNLIGTGPNYTASVAGSYTCEAREGNYEPFYCDNFKRTVIVGETLPPVVDASEDQVLCADNPSATISATIQYSTTGIWTGGNGVFTPSDEDFDMVYTPTSAEIDAGSVILTLTSTGAGSGCLNSFDEVQLFFIDTIQTSLEDITLGCFGETALISPIITGGLAPTQYLWSNGVTTLDNTLGAGIHCLTVTDDNGCQITDCFEITTSSELVFTVSSTPATINGGNDGTATALPSGGTPPYTYDWSNGGTNQTETGLSYGIYTVTVTDDAGCTRTQSVVVNEPRCDGFVLNTSATDVLCNDGATGTATVIASGGQEPYTYQWNDGASQTNSVAVGLPAGVYEIIVEDDDNCISVSTATVFEPSALMNIMTQSNVTIEGGNDGSAEANVSGGFGAYTYDWSSGDNTSAINGLIAGWYIVEISDENNCVLVDSVFINQPPCDQFQLLVSTISPVCNGDLTGEANLSLLNGAAPYSINWSTGENDVLSISGAAAGIHTVEVTDAQGCFTFLNFGISEPSPLSIGLASTPSTCYGYNNGTIDMSIAGGTYPYYSYSWSSGQTTEDIIHLAPGFYSVMIEDTNGCQANANTTIVDPLELTITLDSIHMATCFGGTDGAIYITANGGNMTYSYDWSNGASSQDITGIDVGGYIINVMDGSFCELDKPITYFITEPELVEADTIIIHCPTPGETTTSVEITPIGGTSDYAISSDNGMSYGVNGTYTLELATGNSYDIIVRDVNNCVSSAYTINIDETLTIDDIAFNLCYGLGQTDELINVSISGGSADYSVSTNGGSSYGSEGVYSIAVPVNSDYDVTVMDANGCESVATTISLPNIFTSSINATSNYNGFNISCNGLSDGEATVTPTGGSETYTYLWNNGAVSNINSGIASGNHTVQITDGNGCVINNAVILNEPTAVNESFVSSSYASGDNISCNGLSDGSIDVTIVGGTGVYTYDWDNDGTGDVDDTQDLSLLSAGDYALTGTDQNGCPFSLTITLSEPSALSDAAILSSNPSGDNISCIGMNDGSINYTVNGGAGSYTFDWDNDGVGDNNDTEDLASLVAGTYTVIATDLNGCTISESIILTEPTSMSQAVSLSSFPSGDNISCNGMNDGSIDYTINGGAGGNEFEWSTSDGSGLVLIDEDQSGLTAGTYTLTVTNMNGCSIDTTIILTEPVSLAYSIDPYVYPSGDNITCFGYNDGSIDFICNGGALPYTFDWDNDGTGDFDDPQSLSDITAGTYNIIAMDINGCTISDVVTLIEPSGPNQSVETSIQPSGYAISCYNQTDGWIDYTITGGAQPFTYDWDIDGLGDNDDLEDLSNLPAGTYNLTATDQNGCQVFQSVTLIEPDSLMLSGIIGNTSCYDVQDGLIDISLSGGTLPYSFDWSNGSDSEDIANLGDGTYDISIVDAQGCTQSATFIVTEPDSLYISLFSPLNFHDHNIDLYGGNDGSIDATIYGGTENYTFNWSNGQNSEDLSGITAGQYILTVIDAQGCMAIDTIRLTEPFDLELPTAFSPNNDDANDAYVIKGIEAYPDNNFSVYNRWGNMIFNADGYNNTWGGTNENNQLIPDGVYFVILNINDGEIERSTYVHIKTH